MNRLVALAVVVASSVVNAAAPQPPTFSTAVQAVRVDVLVTEGERPLLGLTPADFEVRDNGVLQDVSFVSTEKLPLNVILALDTSASVSGEPLQHLQSAGRTLLDRLEPEDRAALVTFSHEVTLRQALTRDADRVGRELARIEPRGETAVIDASYAAVMLGDTDVGRDLVIVFSDGVDTASWLSGDRVLDAARRSDVVVYGVSVRSAERPDFLRELSRVTGGSLLEVDSTRDLGSAFVRLLQEFRQRYLLNYVPRGVSSEGWHELRVTVKRRRATVSARAGYAASAIAGAATR
jgi:Ca-activated chloride channel family protein